MNTERPILIGATLAVLSLGTLLSSEFRTAVHAAEGDQVEYTFGRPITEGEQTYEWYRKTHAEEAAKRYGVNPDAVGDGMDTWHWWTGVGSGGSSPYCPAKLPIHSVRVSIFYRRCSCRVHSGGRRSG